MKNVFSYDSNFAIRNHLLFSHSCSFAPPQPHGDAVCVANTGIWYVGFVAMDKLGHAEKFQGWYALVSQSCRALLESFGRGVRFAGFHDRVREVLPSKGYANTQQCAILKSASVRGRRCQRKKALAAYAVPRKMQPLHGCFSQCSI